MNGVIREITIWFGLFSCLFVLSFSFPFQVIPDLGGFLEGYFNDLWRLTGGLFGVDYESYHSGEDSFGMLFNTFSLVFLSIVIYVVLYFRLSNGKKEALSVWGKVLLRYYLATMLLIYGFDKVYKWQFYSPESNILFTRVKDLPQDMLYWTTMGTSYLYSVFAGVLEVIAGLFLLFRKTLVVGLFLSLGVLGHVFMVNIGFDITVKLFSGFLLFISVVLLLPFLSQLLNFFKGAYVQLNVEYPNYAKHRFYIVTKVLVLVLILVETQYKYISSGNFNDDLAVRPHFNGAYDVISGEGGIERVHFHRHGYFILEKKNGVFYDFKLEVDSLGHRFLLLDYNKNQKELNYSESGDTLKIYDTEGGFSIVTLKQYL